nr:CpsD/CapB family tyrosine-protein kinase [Sedimentibacter sp.]
MEGYIVKDHHGIVTESYRKVVANIEFANIDNDIKSIMVTSTLAGEGKTTTVANLASFMTDSNKKVLLLDLDLRKPTIHKQFMISNKYGLTDLLLNKDDYKKYTTNVIQGLDVITSGSIVANPAEIISSKAIRDLLKELSSHYDYVFVDTPPIAIISDPITIATYVDAVILIVSYSQTEKEIAKKSINNLKHINANIIGTILNKSPMDKRNKGYYGYY